MFKATSEKTSVTYSGDPTIYVSVEALNRMAIYVQEVDDEVGWLGTVKRIGKMTYLIDNVFMLKQKVHGATCEIDPADIARLGEELEDPNEMLFWGHSHVNMPCGPSGQDDTQLAEFGENGAPFFIRGIFNKKGEARFDLSVPEFGLLYKNVHWEVMVPNMDLTALREEIKGEIKEKVSKLYTAGTHSTFPARQGSYQGSQQGHYSGAETPRPYQTGASTTTSNGKTEAGGGATLGGDGSLVTTGGSGNIADDPWFRN